MKTLRPPLPGALVRTRARKKKPHNWGILGERSHASWPNVGVKKKRKEKSVGADFRETKETHIGVMRSVSPGEQLSLFSHLEEKRSHGNKTSHQPPEIKSSHILDGGSCNEFIPQKTHLSMINHFLIPPPCLSGLALIGECMRVAGRQRLTCDVHVMEDE